MGDGFFMLAIKACECGCGLAVTKRFSPGHNRRNTTGACAKGHPWTKENSYYSLATGKRCCRACKMVNQKERRALVPEVYWETALKIRYHLDTAAYEEMLRQQCGLCAICGRFFDGYNEPLIDHNHDTGEVRGMLCRRCNTGIGMLDHSPALLAVAMEYLRGRPS